MCMSNNTLMKKPSRMLQFFPKNLVIIENAENRFDKNSTLPL